MVHTAKPIPPNDDVSSSAEWYLTVRCTNVACTQLIAFQKAVFCGEQMNVRLVVAGEPSVDCPYCGTRVRFNVDEIERRKVVLTRP